MTTRSPDSTPNHFIHPKSQAQFRELAATTEQVRKIRSNIASHCSKCRRGGESEKDMQRCARVCNRLLFLHLTLTHTVGNMSSAKRLDTVRVR